MSNGHEQESRGTNGHLEGTHGHVQPEALVEVKEELQALLEDPALLGDPDMQISDHRCLGQDRKVADPRM